MADFRVLMNVSTSFSFDWKISFWVQPNVWLSNPNCTCIIIVQRWVPTEFIAKVWLEVSIWIFKKVKGKRPPVSDGSIVWMGKTLGSCFCLWCRLLARVRETNFDFVKFRERYAARVRGVVVKPLLVMPRWCPPVSVKLLMVLLFLENLILLAELAFVVVDLSFVRWLVQISLCWWLWAGLRKKAQWPLVRGVALLFLALRSALFFSCPLIPPPSKALMDQYLVALFIACVDDHES